MYTGSFIDDKRQGKGMYVKADSSKYEGDWSNDMMHGQGEFH